MNLSRVLALVSIPFLVSVASAMDVEVDYDKSIDFSRYQTFAWQNEASPDDSFVYARAVDAVKSQLEVHGLREVKTRADLNVVLHLSIGEDRRIFADGFGYGGWPGWGGWGGWGTSTVNVSEIPAGTVMVDLVEAATNQLVWRGVASGTVKGKGPEQSEKRINKAAAKMFRSFPP